MSLLNYLLHYLYAFLDQILKFVFSQKYGADVIGALSCWDAHTNDNITQARCRMFGEECTFLGKMPDLVKINLTRPDPKLNKLLKRVDDLEDILKSNQKLFATMTDSIQKIDSKISQGDRGCGRKIAICSVMFMMCVVLFQYML